MRKLAFTVALASTALATPVLARDNAWYVGVEGGGMIVEDMDYDITRPGAYTPADPSSLGGGATTKNALSVNSRSGLDADAIIGYDFGGFRVEGEVGYKRAEVTDLRQGAIALPDNSTPVGAHGVGYATTAGFNWAGARGNTSALSFMLNGMLDFGDDDGWQGFIGGGAGMARVKVSDLRVTKSSPVYINDSDSKFAWQAIAGVRKAVTSNVDLGLKYRYFNVSGLKYVSNYTSSGKTDFRSHSLLASLIYNFGEPAAPPPPPPPPAPEVVPPAPPAPPVAECQPGPYIVFFDFDKSYITPEAASILDNAAANYANCGNASVMLAGHADKSGSPKYNQALSERRNAEVRAYLASRGVPDGVMSSQGFGESMPLVDTADGVKEPQNRRVEIKYGM